MMNVNIRSVKALVQVLKAFSFIRALGGRMYKACFIMDLKPKTR